MVQGCGFKFGLLIFAAISHEMDAETEEGRKSSTSELLGEEEEEEEEESSGEEEIATEDEEESGGETRKDDVKKKKKVKRRFKALGHRRNLRSKFERVEDLNPEALSAQTEEQERIRRLELQQSLLQPSGGEREREATASTSSQTEKNR